jgi:hypothetical protein
MERERERERDREAGPRKDIWGYMVYRLKAASAKMRHFHFKIIEISSLS